MNRTAQVHLQSTIRLFRRTLPSLSQTSQVTSLLGEFNRLLVRIGRRYLHRHSQVSNIPPSLCLPINLARSAQPHILHILVSLAQKEQQNNKEEEVKAKTAGTSSTYKLVTLVLTLGRLVISKLSSWVPFIIATASTCGLCSDFFFVNLLFFFERAKCVCVVYVVEHIGRDWQAQARLDA